MRQQPDLNWDNPEVKKAMWDAARFWLDMGVDGFRLDAIGNIYEDPDLTPHNVPMNLAELRHFADIAKTPKEIKLKDNYWFEMFRYQRYDPPLHKLMKQLRAVVDEYDGDRMLVGEDDNIDFLGDGDDELHLVFNFPLANTKRITPQHVRRNQEERFARLNKLPKDGWACNTLGNHDRHVQGFPPGTHATRSSMVRSGDQILQDFIRPTALFRFYASRRARSI